MSRVVSISLFILCLANTTSAQIDSIKNHSLDVRINDFFSDLDTIQTLSKLKPIKWAYGFRDQNLNTIENAVPEFKKLGLNVDKFSSQHVEEDSCYHLLLTEERIFTLEEFKARIIFLNECAQKLGIKTNCSFGYFGKANK